MNHPASPGEGKATTLLIRTNSGEPAAADPKSAAVPLRVSAVHRLEDSSVTRLETALRAREPAYGRLLESIYDGVFITDEEGVVLDFNSRGRNMFRLPETTGRGFAFLPFVVSADSGLLRQIHDNLHEHLYTIIDGRCRRADGTTFPAEIVVHRTQSVLLSGTAVKKLLFFVRDVSRAKKTVEELAAANERLRAVDRSRLEFISNVSHELRTPVTSMIYDLHNLQRGIAGELSDELRGHLERMEGDCRRLLGTVNDILDLRKIDSGSLTLATRRVPLSRLVRGCAETLRVQAEAKGQTLLVDAPDAGTFCDCDVEKMERVGINILGNAVKFTPEGGAVRLSVRPGPASSDGKSGPIVITCDDTGIGIPPEALQRVGERYFRVGEQVSGTGLGLAISKEVVRLHGGSLTVESPVPGTDRGTRVTVRIPASEAPLVLVVDDEPPVLELLAEDLKDLGYRVLAAGSVAEARRVAEGKDVAAVVLDINLPDEKGTGIILSFRSDPSRARLPIVAVSGADPERMVQDILRRFHIPLLKKPWRPEDIGARIASALYGA